MKIAHETSRLPRVTLKWALALTILAGVILGNYLFVSFQIDQIRARDQFLNLANRQAMLVQRCSVFFWLVLKTAYVPDRIPLHQELVELVIQSEDNFNDLKKMSRRSYSGFFGRLPEWTRIPPDIEKFLEEYLTHLKAFVATPTRRMPQYISNPTVAFIGRTLERGRAMPSLSEWVEVCARENEEDVQRFHQWIFWMLIFDFVLLAGIGIFIFHPMSLYISRQFYHLNRSRTTLALAQRIAHIGSWELDLDNVKEFESNLLRWSDETYRIFGYEPGEIRVTSTLFWQSVHPDDRERVAAAVKEAIRSYRTYEVQHRIIRKDGRERIVIEHADIQWESGAPVRLIGTVQDITEQKKAEQELVSLKNRLARDLDAMNRLHGLSTTLITVTDFSLLLTRVLDDVILLQNADFGTIQLYDEKTASLAIVAQRGFKEEFLTYFQNAAPTASACGLAVKRRERVLIEDVEKDDYYAPSRGIAAQAGFRAVHSIPMLSREGKIIGVISTYFSQPHHIPEHTLRLTDLFVHHVCELIQRRQAEDALRKSEEEFRTMFELSIVGQTQADPTTLKFYRLNKKFCEMTGYDAQELSSKTVWDLTHPDDREMSREQWAKALKGEIREVNIEKRYVRKDGRVLWVHVAGSILRDQEGKPLRTASIIQDISERKWDEEALRTANHELRDLTTNLERRVEERTQRLEEQAVQLRQLAVELTEAEQTERKRIAQILHDHMQQILVAAKLRLDLLERKIPEEDKKSVRDSRLFIEQAVKASRSLTAELRPPVLYEGGLSAALNFLAAKVEEEQQLKVVMVTVGDIEPSSDFLKGMIYQSVQELLFNTAKYANVHQCSLKVERMERGDLHVCVSDEGAGFDPDNIGRKGVGGFGLFSIRERIKALGGEFAISSSPGKGATFKLIFPDRQELQIPAEEIKKIGLEEVGKRRVEESKKKAGVRVLLVDDHKFVRQTIGNFLRSQSFIKEVIEAEDGEDAVRKVQETDPDIVIMDLHMPKMNGVEATRILHDQNKRLKIIGLSIQGDEWAARSMMNVGASAYFNKSEDTASLVETIQSMVDRQ